MSLIVASWNIEKNGQSSALSKQTKVSDFVDLCCKEESADVLFLSEVHTARIDDYLNYLCRVYGGRYLVYPLYGGHSNAYILATRKVSGVTASYDILKHLKRGVLLLQAQDLAVVAAHFKSGQNGLTKDQIEAASDYLESLNPGRWAVLGDLNWDYHRAGELAAPGNAHPYTMWPDATQAKGGILDWCMAGGATKVQAPDGWNQLFANRPELIDMKGPDHKPVIFELDLA